MQIKDVTIVGAGPAGLAAAIAAKRLGLDYSIVEKGVLVNSIYRFPVNMVFFTTPELLEIGGLPLVSPFEKPTRIEALRYYRRVVDTYNLQIEFGEQVIAVNRRKASGEFVTAATSSLPSDISITRIFSVCRARICRTCRITTTSRTASIESGS
jgi:thioredoxin reductase (NADPH)